MRYIYALKGDLRPYEDSKRWEAGEEQIGVFCELTASKENYKHFQWLSDFMGLHILGGFGIPYGISKDEQELLAAINKCGATYNHYDLKIELVGVEIDGQIFRK